MKWYGIENNHVRGALTEENLRSNILQIGSIRDFWKYDGYPNDGLKRNNEHTERQTHTNIEGLTVLIV